MIQTRVDRAHPAKGPARSLGWGSPSVPGRTTLLSLPSLVGSGESGWLFRWGAGPYLMALDSCVFLAAAVLGGHLDTGHLITFPIMIAVFAGAGLYRPRLSLSLLNDLPHLLPALAASLMAGFTVLWLLPVADSGTGLLSQTVPLLVALLLCRGAAYRAIRFARASGRIRHVTLILGAGHVGISLTRALKEHPEYGIDAIGFVDSHSPVLAEPELPAPLLGGHEHLAELISHYRVRNVMVAFGATPERELVDILRTCDRLDCEIFLVPRLFELQFVTRDMDSVWGMPLVRVRRAPYRTFSWRVKRMFDLVLSALSLVLLAPLLLACALAVRWETGPGVLFKQTRVGLDGRPFKLLKFRSLAPIDESESQTRWTISDDDRVGPVGRLLRATSLDELPQLFNVLVGDMSLVGPRPERPHFVSEFQQDIPRYMARHRVPAGLTGYAQVHGLRGDTSIEDRARFDNIYIENWSLWGDVKILLKTVGQVMRRGGG